VSGKDVSIKMCLRDIGRGVGKYIGLPEDKDQNLSDLNMPKKHLPSTEF
jgi:hypothetical protein